MVSALLCASVGTCGAGAQTSREPVWAREFVRSRGGNRTALTPTSATVISASPHAGSLSTPWQPLGPSQIETAAYGKVTGRVTSIAVDPADASGNTVYIGTTGGGVWKSTDAAGDAANVHFVPLTDTLSVFGAGVPSLSIGAITVSNTGVVLAGTGDPNDATDSYYGQGILRSTDGGATWSLIAGSTDNHSFAGEGFAGFAWSTSTPNLVVAAVSHSTHGTLTGAFISGKSARGLYYSVDRGATWTMASLFDGSTPFQVPSTNFNSYEGNAATSVVWDAKRQRFYAAVRYHGYYESTDGRVWTRLANQPGSALTTANCPARPATTGAQSCPVFRGALAVQPETGDLFALTVDLNNNDVGLYQDVCAWNGSSCANNMVQWAKRWDTAALETSSTIPQGDYNLVLAALPSASDTLLFVGTTEIYRCSLAAGCAFRNTTNATTGCVSGAHVAPAQHAIAWTGQAMYFGNDGGLWRSLDNVNQAGASCGADDAAHFQNLNGGIGSLAQVSAVASDPTDAKTLLVALGANGSAAITSATTSDTWTQLGTGESGYVAIDPKDPRNWFVQSGGGISIVSCSQGGTCTANDFARPAQIGATQVGGDSALPSPPFLLDPAWSANVIVGTCRVWRGDASNGALWSPGNAISPALAGPTGAACSNTNAFIRSLAAGGDAVISAQAQNTGSPVLYAGIAGQLDGGSTYGGHVFSTTDAKNADSATAWTDRALVNVTNDAANGGLFNPGHFDISSLYADPHDTTGKTVYATIMGFGYPHLYRSRDAGATWMNLSSNLPNAPANAVVVDPMDANTVYVATDAGVYATTSIDTCAAADCWNLYGTGLPNAPVIALDMQSNIAAQGASDNGVLRAGTYGRGVWEIPLIHAGAVVLPDTTASPNTLIFSAQAVGTTSTSQDVLLTNSGAASSTLGTPSVTGDFTIASNGCGASLAVGAHCAVSIAFRPSTAGSRNGAFTLAVDAGTISVPLAGAGTGTFIGGLTPSSLTFAATTIGSTSDAQNIVVSNTGSILGSVGGFIATGDFVMTANTCGPALAPHTSCTVSIAFKPTSSGARSGTFSLTSDSGPLTASLSGTGTTVATDTLSTSSLTFSATLLNITSAAQAITLRNDGDVALTLISASILSGDFAVTHGCGTALAAHSSCSLQITFTPRTVGQQIGVLSVRDALGTQTVTLTGTGLAPAGLSLSPASLSFGATGVRQASTPQVLTLTNNGGSPLSISAIGLSGDFGLSSVNNACSTTTTLPVNANCQIVVSFVPQSAGARTGLLTLVSNAVGGSYTIPLSGTGVDFTLAASGETTRSIASGSTAAFAALIAPSVAMNQSVSLACSGVPANTKCTVSPAATDLTTTQTLTVTLRTGISSNSVITPVAMMFVLLLPVSFVTLRRRMAVLMLFVLFASSITGCGSGRRIPESYSNDPGTTVKTPSGSYPITVTATSAGLSRAITFTLNVQ